MKIVRLQSDYWNAEGAAAHNRKFELHGNAQSLSIAPTTLPNEEVLSKEELASKVEQMNKTALIFNKRMHFQIHEDTQRVMVKIMNSDTGEVISEIPSEKLLDMVARMEEMVGTIIDKRI